jgi:hypothetical protein
VDEPATKQPAERAQTTLYVKAQPGLKLRDKKTERLARRVRQAMPWIQPSDAVAVRAFCELEVLAEQVYAVLRFGGVVNREGDARRLLNDYRKLRATQAVWVNAIGATPAARAALKTAETGAVLDLESFRHESGDTAREANRLTDGAESAAGGDSEPTSATHNDNAD